MPWIAKNSAGLITEVAAAVDDGASLPKPP
jgi:hypothetical protein